MPLSNSQIEKLGNRLRENQTPSDEDLSLLDEFRETYSKTDEYLYGMVQEVLASQTNNLTLTKRKRKTRPSIVDKLNRQPKLRLPQMQDIAGCRIVLKGGIKMAENINLLLLESFKKEQLDVQSKDRSTVGGYRAIHLIVIRGTQFYEIQLRTYSQDVWANTVERVSNKDNTLKYGGSSDERHLITKLKALSESFSVIDEEAHRASVERYHNKVKEGINDVLSN